MKLYETRLVYTMETGTIESGLHYRDWVALSSLGYTIESGLHFRDF